MNLSFELDAYYFSGIEIAIAIAIDIANMPELPYAYTVLVLGIASIASCFCFGFVGIICSLTALFLARKAMGYYEMDPYGYRDISYNNVKIGRACARIGLVLSSLYAIFFTVWLIFREPNV